MELTTAQLEILRNGEGARWVGTLHAVQADFTVEWLDAVRAGIAAGESLTDAIDSRRMAIHITTPWAAWTAITQEHFKLCYMERARAMQPIGAARPLEAAIPPPAARQRVHVRIHQNTGEWLFSIKLAGVSQHLPPSASVRPFLPPAERCKLKAGRDTGRWANERRYKNALEQQHISPQLLADAIKGYLLAGLEQPLLGEAADQAEDAALMRMQPATLIAGGVAYRLTPVGGADLRQPLRNIRRRANDVVQAEAATLRASLAAEITTRAAVARQDAQSIVRQAEQQAARIRVEIARQRERAALTLPEWLLGCPGPFRLVEGRYWQIYMDVATQLKSVQMYVSRWELMLYWDAVRIADEPPGMQRMLVSVLLNDADGTYSLNGCKAAGGYLAPHIGHRGCMELQGLPPKINSLYSLAALEAAIGRGNRVINMNSLLSRDINTWHPWIIAQVPVPIRDMLTSPADNPWPAHWAGAGESNSRDRWAADGRVVSWQRETTLEAEAAETFVVGAGTGR